MALTKLIYRRPKDLIDLERLFAVLDGELDTAYVRRWLAHVTSADDQRLQILADLERRFARPG